MSQPAAIATVLLRTAALMTIVILLVSLLIRSVGGGGLPIYEVLYGEGAIVLAAAILYLVSRPLGRVIGSGL